MTPLIRTTLLTFIAVLALYEVALRLAAPVVDQGADMGITNAIHLENYADGAAAPDTVMVGSSLAARLQARLLPPTWSNIALIGGSALTGLEVVTQSPPRPRRVLIEINYLDRPADPAAVRALLDWPQPLLRHLFWFSRAAYMPINLIFSETEDALIRRRAAHGGGAEVAPANAAQLAAMLKPAYAKSPDLSGLTELAGLIRKLQARGIAVGFFEMPVDPSLANTPHLAILRDRLHAMFRSQDICWLALDQNQAWHTGDGEHLLTQDAARVAQTLAAAHCS